MQISDAIEKFEQDNEEVCTEIILLGKNGSVRRLTLESLSTVNYIN